MARFLFVNQHYWPDLASTGQHLTDLAEHLASAGHEVQVLCARPAGASGRSTLVRETHNGVRIRRVGRHRWIGAGRPGLLRRAASYLGFHLRAGLCVLAARGQHAVVTLTTPPLLGLWGSVGRRLGGPPHVCFLMDHHPDAEFELGLIDRRSVLGRTLEALYGWTLRAADVCVALGPWQAQRAARRGVPAARQAVIPIWTRREDVQPVPHADNPLRAELAAGARTVVLYSGNAGLVHRFEELIEAMEILDRTDPDVLFAFVGGGPRRAELERAVSERGLQNAVFEGYRPRSELSHSLSVADVHFLSLRPEHAGVSVPSKLYGQLASARPVLFVGPAACESAADLSAAGAGWSFEPGPGTGAELAATIARLKRDPELGARLGRRGRAWFLEHRERAGSCEAWRELLEGVAAERTASGPVRAATPEREAA